jgi:hypothetical protein
MTLIKARSRGINLADTFAFTGTVSGAGGVDMSGTAWRANAGSEQTLSHVTWAKGTNFTTEAYDPGSNYDATNSKYVVPSDGFYYVYYHTQLLASSANNFMVKVYVNGSSTESSMGDESAFLRYETAGYQSYFSMSSSYVAQYSANDYLELYHYIEDSSGTLKIGSGKATAFWGGYKIA